jgi:hypothetical protein
VTPRRSIFGQIAKSIFVPNKGAFVTHIDRPSLLSRLLFFDEVIIRSIRMQEIPFLVKLFGVDGLDHLMSQGILKISCEAFTIVLDRHRNGIRDLPLLQFEQGTADVPDHQKYVEECTSCLQQITGLSNSDRVSLAEKLYERAVHPGPKYNTDLLDQIRKDLKSNSWLMKSLIVADDLSLKIEKDAIELSVENISEGIQRFETNLHALSGMSTHQEHAVLDSVIRAAANLNHRLADMHEYSAITFFQESEAPLLFGKIHGIIAPYNPSFEENSFLRVLELTDIANLLATGRIDVEKLLKIKSSNECREFRSWLSSADEINDEELKRLLTGLRARAASFINSTKGKTIRFAANAGLGLIPGYGTAISLTEGALDTFLLDKMLPSSGILSFLNNSIPSVFKNAYE